MKVELLQNGVLIGSSHLDAADPSMGVASGSFEPTSDYDPQRHAITLDGEDNVLLDEEPLSVRSEVYGVIACEGVVIEDYSKTLGEIHVSVLGIGYPDYETFFGLSPSFEAH